MSEYQKSISKLANEQINIIGSCAFPFEKKWVLKSPRKLLTYKYEHKDLYLDLEASILIIGEENESILWIKREATPHLYFRN